jgi:hypothetical protein
MLRTELTYSEIMYAIYFFVRGWQCRRDDARTFSNKMAPALLRLLLTLVCSFFPHLTAWAGMQLKQ